MSERLLTARELGELLGLSTTTVLDRFEAGDLPGFRLFAGVDRRGRPTGPVRFRWVMGSLDGLFTTTPYPPSMRGRREYA
jgi:hypothetical protein